MQNSRFRKALIINELRNRNTYEKCLYAFPFSLLYRKAHCKVFVKIFRLYFCHVNFNVYLCRSGLKMIVKPYFAITMKEQQDDKQGAQKGVLRQSVPYNKLFFYQKADAIYQLTYVFCQRFLPKYGDRTVDQMVQAARSGKQNIVEGIEDGSTSTEMELKLLNVARSSLQELREDYDDYLHTRCLTRWTSEHSRYNAMLDFCKRHNKAGDYLLYANKWTAEEFCNTLLTLCHITDKMMCSYLARLEKQFVEQGGIKERMYAARTGYRKAQEELLKRLQAENVQLKAEVERLKAELAKR